MSAEVDEAVASELELAVAMYGEDITVKQCTGYTSATVRLQPRSGCVALQRFMEVVVEVRLPQGYPKLAAAVRLARSRGLIDDEERKLVAEAAKCASECAEAGEGCLFTTLELVIELLTEMNTGGSCPMCRDPLFGAPEDDPGASPRKVYLSQCYHSFHSECARCLPLHACRASSHAPPLHLI